MSITEPNWDAIYMGSPYTLSEACDIMRNLDKFPTTRRINWVNSKTGEPVSIGYSDAPSRRFKMIPSKSEFIPQNKRSPKQKCYIK